MKTYRLVLAALLAFGVPVASGPREVYPFPFRGTEEELVMAAKTTKWLGSVDGSMTNASNYDNGVPTSVTASAFYDTLIFSASATRGPSSNMDFTATDGVNGLHLAAVTVEPGFRFDIGSLGSYFKCTIVTLKHEGRSSSLYWENQKGSGGSHTSTRVLVDSENTGTALMLINSVGLTGLEIKKGGVQVTAGTAGISTVHVGFRENPFCDARYIRGIRMSSGVLYQTGGFVSVGGLGGTAEFHQDGGVSNILGDTSCLASPGVYELNVWSGRSIMFGLVGSGIGPNVRVGGGVLDLRRHSNVSVNDTLELIGSTVLTNSTTLFTGTRTQIGV